LDPREPGHALEHGNDMELLENTNHSFIVKVWLETAGGEGARARWRGQIDHIPGGERFYFNEPDEILTIISAFLRDPRDSSAGTTRGDMVRSLFPFLREREPAEEVEAPPDGPEEAPAAAADEPAAGESLDMAAVAASPHEALTNMRNRLEDYLPPGSPSLPDPDVSVTSVSELPLAIGNFRGMDRRGTFAVAALKGGRLEAAVRFQLWGSSPGDVNGAMDDLHAALLAAKDELWLEGFLRMSAGESSPTEHVPSVDAWRKSADYNILYEFHSVDSDGAESLIARIPIDVDTDTGSEFTLVTDEMTRWDNEVARTLVVRGRFTVGVLSSLAFVPGPPPGGPVSLTRTHDGAAGPPTSFATLADFLTAVTDPLSPNRHGQVVFPTLTAFLDHFVAVDDPIVLGDWNEDGVPDLFQASRLAFDPVIHLQSAGDRLELACQDSAFDQVAIVYLQAMPV